MMFLPLNRHRPILGKAGTIASQHGGLSAATGSTGKCSTRHFHTSSIPRSKPAKLTATTRPLFLNIPRDAQGNFGISHPWDPPHIQAKSEMMSAVMRCRVENPEHFYFREASSTFCRLCDEEIRDGRNSQLAHRVAMDRAGYGTHMNREIILDSLTLLCKRGVDIKMVPQIWAEYLIRCDEYPRIRSLTGSHLSLSDRASRVRKYLHFLKEIGILALSLVPGFSDSLQEGQGTSVEMEREARRRLSFERLECIGDNCWGGSISTRIIQLLPDRLWIHSYGVTSFNFLRDAMEMNANLDQLYDLLELSQLLDPSYLSRVDVGKVKADVVESLIGELHVTLWGYEPELYTEDPMPEITGDGQISILGLIQHVITELFDLCVLNPLYEFCETALPLAQELSLEYWVMRLQPSISRQKDRVTRLKKMSSAHFRKCYLPPKVNLHSTPTSMEEQKLKQQQQGQRKEEREAVKDGGGGGSCCMGENPESKGRISDNSIVDAPSGVMNIGGDQKEEREAVTHVASNEVNKTNKTTNSSSTDGCNSTGVSAEISSGVASLSADISAQSDATPVEESFSGKSGSKPEKQEEEESKEKKRLSEQRSRDLAALGVLPHALDTSAPDGSDVFTEFLDIYIDLKKAELTSSATTAVGLSTRQESLSSPAVVSSYDGARKQQEGGEESETGIENLKKKAAAANSSGNNNTNGDARKMISVDWDPLEMYAREATLIDEVPGAILTAENEEISSGGVAAYLSARFLMEELSPTPKSSPSSSKKSDSDSTLSPPPKISEGEQKESVFTLGCYPVLSKERDMKAALAQQILTQSSCPFALSSRVDEQSAQGTLVGISSSHHSPQQTQKQHITASQTQALIPGKYIFSNVSKEDWLAMWPNKYFEGSEPAAVMSLTATNAAAGTISAGGRGGVSSTTVSAGPGEVAARSSMASSFSLFDQSVPREGEEEPVPNGSLITSVKDEDEEEEEDI